MTNILCGKNNALVVQIGS